MPADRKARRPDPTFGEPGSQSPSRSVEQGRSCVGARGYRSGFRTRGRNRKGIRIRLGAEGGRHLAFVRPDGSGNSARIGALSLKHRIPLVSPFREITDAGGLLSYGPDLSMLFRRSASLVDQILKGAKPGDLPIGKPSDFELGANLQTARALNITIPASILSRATYVRQQS